MAENGWHIMDKRVTWGHVLLTIGLLVSGLLAFTDLSTDVRVNTTKIETVEKSVSAVKISVNSQYAEIIRRLERLDDRIADHMAEGDG